MIKRVDGAVIQVQLVGALYFFSIYSAVWLA